MIEVPDAALLPSQPRPVRRAKSSSIGTGNPRGYVRNGFSSNTPQISQCPVVLSFPADAGRATPYAAVGLTPGANPGRTAPSRHFPSPSFSRLGSFNPPTARATLPSVSEPASPYAAVSGAGPLPSPSRTMMAARPVPDLTISHGYSPQARAQSRQEFVLHITTPVRDLFQSNALFRVCPDDGGNIADLHFEGAGFDERHVHLHEPDDRATLTAQQDSGSAAREHPPQPVGIPAAQRCDHRVPLRGPARVVARGVSFTHPPHAQHSGSHAHDWSRLRQIIGRRAAVQKDPRPHQVERELLASQCRGAVRDVQQRRSPRQPRDRAEEPFELPLRRAVPSLGGVEVRVAPLERRRVDRCPQLLDLVPAHPGASHSRIDLDMEGALAARGPFEDARS